MLVLQEQLFEELRTLVADLGKDGGLISPSVYDTAQLLRLYPPQEGVDPGLDWLISQQKADGGWGDPSVPTARDVPTLAALLTIFTYRRDRTSRKIIQAGLEFLQLQSSQWTGAAVDALPVAAEMILPRLVQEACSAGLQIDDRPYLPLFKLRAKKLQYMRKNTLRAGTAPTHSWEALDLEVSSNLLDGSGGIGHSPSATAAWLKKASEKEDLQNYISIAKRYLAGASRATGIDIPGVVPNVWPITGVEFAYGLYVLQNTGLLNRPELSDVVAHKSRELYQILTTGSGVSFGDFFISDVDDTAVAVITLQHLGYQVRPDSILQFRYKDHFCTFPNELNPSVFSNAHAVHALSRFNRRCLQTEQFLVNRQKQDGKWAPDKWHSSWRYTTLEVILSLAGLGHDSCLQSASMSFVRDQHADGGWGMGHKSTVVETAYSVLALHKLYAMDTLTEDGKLALHRGYQRLLKFVTQNEPEQDKFWIGKELYSPYRVDAIYTLCATLKTLLDLTPQSTDFLLQEI